MLKRGPVLALLASSFALFALTANAEQAHHGAKAAAAQEQGRMPGGMAASQMMQKGQAMPQAMGMQGRMMKGPMMEHMASMVGSGKRHAGQMMPQGLRVHRIEHLEIADVTHFFEHRLDRMNNRRLKLGKVEQPDDDSITVEIVTLDNSLVWKYRVDRHSGMATEVE